MSLREWDYHNLPTPTPHLFRADDRIGRVVPAFHDDVRPKRLHQLERSVFVEHHDEIDRLETGKHVRPVTLCANRAALPLQSFYRAVGVEPNDERIAVGAGNGQQIDMTGMKQIENTVGENDFSRESVAARYRVFPRQRNLVARRPQICSSTDGRRCTDFLMSKGSRSG